MTPLKPGIYKIRYGVDAEDSYVLVSKYNTGWYYFNTEYQKALDDFKRTDRFGWPIEILYESIKTGDVKLLNVNSRLIKNLPKDIL